jgi:hypothetical protein
MGEPPSGSKIIPWKEVDKRMKEMFSSSAPQESVHSSGDSNKNGSESDPATSGACSRRGSLFEMHNVFNSTDGFQGAGK